MDNEKKGLFPDLEIIRAFGKSRFGTMRAFAEAMGISPQHLNSYLNGGKSFGLTFIQRLIEAGFDATQLQSLNNTEGLSNSPRIEPIGVVTPIYLDVTGAQEMTRTPIGRLAQLVQAPPGTLEAWERGDSVPTIAQLASLFNQVVALGLSRFEEQERYQKIIAQAKAEAAKELAAVPRSAVG